MDVQVGALGIWIDDRKLCTAIMRIKISTFMLTCKNTIYSVVY